MKKFIPIVVLICIWMFFCSPVLKANVPFPSKYLVNFFSPWNSYPQFASPVKNESMPDIIGQIYPWKSFTIEQLKNGVIPLWNPYSFSGTPHLANYQSAVLSPLNIIFFVMPFIDAWTVLILLQPLLAGLFTYFYIKSLKKSDWAALVSSISLMFCGFIVTWMAYGTLSYAISFLPLALFAVEKYLEKLKSRYLILLALTIPLSFFSGHFQISIYYLIFIIFYLIFKYFQTKNLHATCYMLLATGFGLLLAAPQLFPTIELYFQSFRSTIFIKTETIPWGYLPTFFAPDYFGNPITRNAWFGHYAEWNAYFGLIPLFFALYAVTSIKKSFVLFFIIAAFVSLLFAFDSPLLTLLVFLKIPVLSTSAASRVIVLFSFSAAILAGLGLDYLATDIKKKSYKQIVVTLGVFTTLFAVLWVVAVGHIFINIEQSLIAKSNLKLPTAFLTALIAAITALTIIKKKGAQTLIFSVIILVIVIDLLRFAGKWMPFDPKNLVYPTVGVVSFFPKIQGPDRIYMNAGAEDSVYYRLQSTEGYDAVYIRRYGQFIASLDDGKLHDSFRSVVAFPKTGKYTLKGANLLGIKYIIHKISDGQNVWEFPFWEYDSKSIKLLFDDSHYQILENTNAYPRAFLVHAVIVEKDPRKILNKMFHEETNLRETAVVEENLHLENGSSGSAVIKTYTPQRIVIQTEGKGTSFLVLTDQYYPEWKVTIDGESKKILRTDFTFKGVIVPSGVHSVEFVYDPASFKNGIYTAIIGLIGVLILIFVNKNRKTENR